MDWADRIDQYDTFSKRQVKVALMFYSHRCLPDSPTADGVSLQSMDLEGLVIGVRTLLVHPVVNDGKPFDELIVLNETELIEASDSI